VRSQLEGVDGVESVEVDYDNKTAVCKVKEGTDPQALLAGLKGDYKGTLQ
jgi:copper chaperone CopZ